MPKPPKEVFSSLWVSLSDPDPTKLYEQISILEQFADYAIDLCDVEALSKATVGWESLLEWSIEEKNLDLHARCLYCQSNIHQGLGDYYRNKMNLLKSAYEAQPNLTPPEGATNPIPEIIEQFRSEARSAWKKERELLYRLSTLDVEHDPKFESAFLCNYGNCLSHVGRTAEAMHRWWTAIQIDPDNMAALVSYGQGCLKFARYFPRHCTLLLDEAYLSFKYALSRENQLVQYWGPQVYVAASKSLDEVLVWWKAQGVDEEEIQKRITARDDGHKGYEPAKHLKQINSFGLLLTVAPRPLACPNTSRDEAFPEATGKRTLKEQQRLMNLLNTIKEDFSLSRFLLFQYMRDSRPQVVYSALTDYVTKPSLNEFGLRPGLIKSVVRTNIDALEKVAKVMEILIELPAQNPGRDLSFNNIWYKNRDRKLGLREDIHQRLEFGSPLFGLYDIHLAWDVEDGPLKSLRDLFVHDVGEVTGYAKYLKVRKPNGKTDEELDLLNLALESLRLLRGAFIILCQIANAEHYGKGEQPGKEAHFHLGRSLSDVIDLGEEIE